MMCRQNNEAVQTVKDEVLGYLKPFALSSRSAHVA